MNVQKPSGCFSMSALGPLQKLIFSVNGVGRLHADLNSALAIDARILRIPDIGRGRCEIVRCRGATETCKQDRRERECCPFHPHSPSTTKRILRNNARMTPRERRQCRDPGRSRDGQSPPARYEKTHLADRPVHDSPRLKSSASFSRILRVRSAEGGASIPRMPAQGARAPTPDP